jgi:hypothetical protein
MEPLRILLLGIEKKIGLWPMNQTREEPNHGTLAYFIIRYRCAIKIIFMARSNARASN